MGKKRDIRRKKSTDSMSFKARRRRYKCTNLIIWRKNNLLKQVINTTSNVPALQSIDVVGQGSKQNGDIGQQDTGENRECHGPGTTGPTPHDVSCSEPQPGCSTGSGGLSSTVNQTWHRSKQNGHTGQQDTGENRECYGPGTTGPTPHDVSYSESQPGCSTGSGSLPSTINLKWHSFLKKTAVPSVDLRGPDYEKQKSTFPAELEREESRNPESSDVNMQGGVSKKRKIGNQSANEDDRTTTNQSALREEIQIKTECENVNESDICNGVIIKSELMIEDQPDMERSVIRHYRVRANPAPPVFKFVNQSVICIRPELKLKEESVQEEEIQNPEFVLVDQTANEEQISKSPAFEFVDGSAVTEGLPTAIFDFIDESVTVPEESETLCCTKEAGVQVEFGVETYRSCFLKVAKKCRARAKSKVKAYVSKTA